MDSSDISQIIVLISLITASAFFSATETAFSSLNRLKLQTLADGGNLRAKKTLKLCEQYDKLLSSILVGNNIVNITSTSLATVLFVKYCGENGVALSTLIMTIIVLIFGEITPKSMAKEAPLKFAMLVTPLIGFISTCLTPVNFVLTMIKNLIARVVNVSDEEGMTDEEILTIVREATNDGVIDENEGELIKSAIEFSDLDISDILTPRIDVVAVDISDSTEEIANAFVESGYSRLPVYSETVDNVKGIINHKDFQHKVVVCGLPLASIIKPAVFVIPGMKISDMLKLFQAKKSHLAIVTDEYGGTVGIVTLEDIIEELVGEIWDEHDEVKEDYVKFSDTCYRVLASANLEKILELFEIKDDEAIESTTIGGWVMEKLAKIPCLGDAFVYEQLVVTVTRVYENRVKEVVIFARDEEAEDS